MHIDGILLPPKVKQLDVEGEGGDGISVSTLVSLGVEMDTGVQIDSGVETDAGLEVQMV